MFLVLTIAFTLNLSHSYRNPSPRLHSEFHAASVKKGKERKRKRVKFESSQISTNVSTSHQASEGGGRRLKASAR